MKIFKQAIAAVEWLLIFPAALFMTALFLREVQPAAQTGRLVAWFAALPVPLGLYLLMVGLPFAAFIIGCATLLRGWRTDQAFREAILQVFNTVRAHMSSLLVAGATVLAGVILALVALHMITE